MIAVGLQKVLDDNVANQRHGKTEAGKPCSYSQTEKKSRDLQDNEFARFDKKHSCRHQCKANDEHCGCGEVEAAEKK